MLPTPARGLQGLRSEAGINGYIALHCISSLTPLPVHSNTAFCRAADHRRPRFLRLSLPLLFFRFPLHRRNSRSAQDLAHCSHPLTISSANQNSLCSLPPFRLFLPFLGRATRPLKEVPTLAWSCISAVDSIKPFNWTVALSPQAEPSLAEVLGQVDEDIRDRSHCLRQRASS